MSVNSQVIELSVMKRENDAYIAGNEFIFTLSAFLFLD